MQRRRSPFSRIAVAVLLATLVSCEEALGPDAAAKLGITRAAIYDAIKKGRLEAEWGETVVRALLITEENLNSYRVDSSRQERGKKT